MKLVLNSKFGCKNLCPTRKILIDVKIYFTCICFHTFPDKDVLNIRALQDKRLRCFCSASKQY